MSDIDWKPLKLLGFVTKLEKKCSFIFRDSRKGSVSFLWDPAVKDSVHEKEKEAYKYQYDYSVRNMPERSNPYYIEDGIVHVKLLNGQIFTIDEIDFDTIKEFYWKIGENKGKKRITINRVHARGVSKEYWIEFDQKVLAKRLERMDAKKKECETEDSNNSSNDCSDEDCSDEEEIPFCDNDGDNCQNFHEEDDDDDFVVLDIDLVEDDGNHDSHEHVANTGGCDHKVNDENEKNEHIVFDTLNSTAENNINSIGLIHPFVNLPGNVFLTPTKKGICQVDNDNISNSSPTEKRIQNAKVFPNKEDVTKLNIHVPSNTHEDDKDYKHLGNGRTVSLFRLVLTVNWDVCYFKDNNCLNYCRDNIMSKRAHETRQNAVRTIKTDPKNGIMDLVTPIEDQLTNYQQKFPQSSFKINFNRTFILKKVGSGWVRVCLHNRSPSSCSECFLKFAQDPNIRYRGPSKTEFAPIPESHRDPLFGRVHKEPSVIPLTWTEEDIFLVGDRLCESGTIVGTDCVITTGCSNDGVGVFSFNGVNYQAHCLSWMIFHRRVIPEGFIIRHLCRTPGCYNPSHVEIGTQCQNMYEDKIRDDTLIFGERHHSAKMSNETALKIFNSRGKGRVVDRAAYFGVNPRTVKRIDAHKGWAHIIGIYPKVQQNREEVAQTKIDRPRNFATRADYERMIQKIQAHSVDGENGCILCTYVRNNRTKGYTSVRMNGTGVQAHIVVWEYFHNNFTIIPEGMVVRHKCDNSQCINPDHLEIGTQGDNVQDSHDRGRRTHGAKEKKRRQE